MNWTKVNDEIPVIENDWEDFLNVMCAKEEEWVVTDSVYDKKSGNFYRNSDTSLAYPLSATHWSLPLDPPMKTEKCKNEFDLCDGTLKHCSCHV